RATFCNCLIIPSTFFTNGVNTLDLSASPEATGGRNIVAPVVKSSIDWRNGVCPNSLLVKYQRYCIDVRSRRLALRTARDCLGSA
ncbi:hypothetical protein F442_04158, partial [Phytophthora nicotianae P10297]